MGVHVIKMPDIGEGIAEVELGAWHVEVGQIVKEDGPLADVMTDKAAVEIPSPVAGKVIALGGKVGEVLAVGSELIRLEVEGEGNLKPGVGGHAPAVANEGRGTNGVSGGTNGHNGTHAAAPANEGAAGLAPQASSAAHTSRSSPTPAARLPSAVRQPDERPLASPAVRQRAWDMGVELRFVHGSGEAGRITHADLDAYAQTRGNASSPTTQARSGYVERLDETAVPVIGMRRAIARKMQEAKRRIPHFSYVEEIDVTELEDLRTQLNQRWAETRGRLTMLPLLIRAMVIALRDFPQINARFDDEAGVVTRYGAVHVGVATQTDAGLTVPVLRHAEARDVWSMAAEIVRLAEAVRSGKASRDELTGSTITISSLGALGGIVSTPVINHPEVGIVGVNRMVERPMIRQGAVVARKMMNLSSSFDHRVVDGMDAAEFIQAVRVLLEQPALLFVE
ncbi:dihydrolipoamide acetyltransferase family protein [Paraburkholderia phenazinium]|uniref:Dihydrolipoamide acetyltransferase component of pyruvate dehydrogenase complex n=1 Tax=Paraburkholderia phenazinium TaxID=60549 RepID=A0A1N6L7D5_9BURK|nr:dihydrolipoamide acetyltransferase family protein [Paraburkholderia phenazinium]SIO64681.1 branched-chain alpha-keto acid dehydrogenase E2 component [Paraburkholderia phenazinium]